MYDYITEGVKQTEHGYVSLKKYITMLDMMQCENITVLMREMTIQSNKHSVGKKRTRSMRLIGYL